MRRAFVALVLGIFSVSADDPFREDLPQFVDSYMTDEKLQRWAKLVQPFSLPMDEFTRTKEIAPWTGVLRKTLSGRMYLEELANLMHDALDLLENIDVPTEMVLDELRLFLHELDLRPPILSLRYIGESRDYESDILVFGQKFNAHLADLLDVVEAGEHDMFLDDLTQDIIEMRHWIDKRWTRSRERKERKRREKDIALLKFTQRMYGDL